GPAAAPAFGESIVVVGTRPRGAAADPTAAVTIVDAGRFAGETKSVADLLATAPGVAVNLYGGLGHLATASIRGSTGDQVPVFLDGLPLLAVGGGAVDLSRIPRQWIGRIEVVRGAEGARFGAAALGGVLNIVTRPAAGAGWAAELSGGSYRTGSGSLEGSSGGESWGLLGALVAEGTGGQFPYIYDPTPNGPSPPVALERTNNAAASGGFLGKAWTTAGAGRVDGVLQLSGGRREVPGSAPSLTPGDSQRDGRAGLVLRWAAPASEDLQLSVDASGRLERLDVTSAALGGGTARQRGAAGSATARATRLAGVHALTATLTGGAERLDSDGGGVHQRPTVALALADDMDLLGGGLRLSPAVRTDRVGPFTGVSAKLGAAALVAGPLSARASAGRSFRPPSFAELYLEQAGVAPNPDLRPEEAWSADAALVLDGAAGRASAGAFWTRYEDTIVYLQTFQRYKPFNLRDADARGAEVELTSAPLGPARLSGQVAYTFLATETLTGAPADVGHDLPQRARHRAFARAGVAPGAFEAHVEAHLVAVQWRDLHNVDRIPDAFLLHAGASLRVARRPDLAVHVEVKNLLDDRTTTDPFLNPLPARMVMVTLRIAGGKDAAP
ncbi:MAG TPA: TonB-dependent receptor, partial [Anaeromyxobacteraceae bacterium]|nr:TonB-dependent receptor [Anaeromyxobacteraceae bacterium]